MTEPRLHITEYLREQMRYDKLAGPVPRILVLESQYWLDSACRNACQLLGWEVQTAPVVTEGVMSREQLTNFFGLLIRFRPDFILAVNMAGMDERGMFARLFEDLQIPLVSWFVDDPRTILMGRGVYTNPYSIACTWERAYEQYLSGLGFATVATLPLAVDPTLFNRAPAETWDVPPTFVGNSMETFARTEWEWLETNTTATEAIQQAFLDGRVTRSNFGIGLEALLDPETLAELDEHGRRRAEIYFFVEGTRRLRQTLVSTLHPEGVAVRGDEGWLKRFPEAGPAINYQQDLPIFYRQCPINLNITSLQMPSTVNQRVFDCPAAGGFLITDAQPALHDLFDADQEVIYYHSYEECLELVRFFRHHPDVRREMTARAARRVFSEHTYSHRLRKIVALLHSRFGGRPEYSEAALFGRTD